MNSIYFNTADFTQALTGLFYLHSPRWLSLIRSIVGNQADAEDVLQESFRRLLAHERAVHSEEEVKLYLNRVIGNTAIDAYHALRREYRRFAPLEDTESLAGPALDPELKIQLEEGLNQEKMLRLAQAALTRLPAKQYEAVRLAVLDPDRDSLRDIGEAIGIPYSTLRDRANKGLKGLRKHIRRNLISG